MGFGFLLVGYFTASFTATMMSAMMLGGFFSFFGYALMIFGAKKLTQYNRNFLYLFISCIIMTAFSAVFAIRDVFSILQAQLIVQSVPISDAAYEILRNVRVAFDFAFVLVLCYCVRSIAKDTGADKISFAATRNFVFYCIYFVLQSTVLILKVCGADAFLQMTLLPTWTVLLQLACMLLINIMLFSCYSKICDSEDVEMKQKPSRFEFINRRREEQAKRDQEYFEEVRKRKEEKMLRKKQKLEEKSKKK